MKSSRKRYIYVGVSSLPDAMIYCLQQKPTTAMCVSVPLGVLHDSCDNAQ